MEPLTPQASKMSLPLTVRKAIRDAEPAMKAAIAEIEAEFGLTGVTFECDYAAIYALAADDTKPRIGEIPVEAYLSKFLPNLKYYHVLEDDINRKAIVGAWTAKKIIFRINPAAKWDGYCKTYFEKGVLIIETKKETFWVNIDECGAKCPDGTGVNLALMKNLRDYEAKKVENLEKISKTLGIPMTFEFGDMAALNKAAEENYKDRVPEVGWDWYLSALAANMEKHCADDMVKEAFVEVMGGKKIILRINDKSDTYHTEFFEKGNLIIEMPSKNFGVNVDSTGEKLQELL